MASRIQVHLGKDAQATRETLEALALEAGAIGQRGPSISVLLRQLAEAYQRNPAEVVGALKKEK